MNAADWQERAMNRPDISAGLFLREIVIYRQGRRHPEQNPEWLNRSGSTDLALESASGEEPIIHRLRIVMYALILLWVVLVALAQFARAGGPKYVAGSSYFNPGLEGQAVTWANATLRYYTDQGDLSPVLRGTDADAFVADAFSHWTSVPTAVISATRVGQLSEDVSGANITVNADRSISLPADVLPSATDKPVAIVYDADGQVTEALLGSGASGVCFNTTAFGGVDAFSVDGRIAHALAVINGTCVQTPADLADAKYALVRTIGQILGVGWSQLNLNVITGTPQPTADDKAGFPLMHPSDPQVCDPISLCYPNSDQLRMDDRAALGRLYPVTAQNVGQFPGKQVFAANTARIHGSVFFVDAFGNPGSPMQGVNVVARWIDPETGKPSTLYSASSVSGFLFRGNSGNPITGLQDPLGQDYARFGSSDTALEGFFDLGGLEIPSGSTGQYQLSVEPLDPDWSGDVGPYAPWQVQPCGVFAPITVTVSKGGDVQRDILMTGSAVLRDAPPVGDWNTPRPVPASGDWLGTIYQYGDTDYFWFTGRSNRTLAIDVTTLDEKGRISQQKAQPVLGAWSLDDPQGTIPGAFTTVPFNAGTAGLSRLSVNLISGTQFRIGIADLRGDGRPDYRYHARVLYADSVTPSRVSVRGGSSIALQGLGFKPDVSVAVGSMAAPLAAASGNQILATAPAMIDGVQSITVSDPGNGATSTMSDVLTYGAAADDLLKLTQSGNPATPVGGQAPSPIRVMVTTSDGTTPVNGATIQWSASNGATLSACGGAASCTAYTDESGEAETSATVGALGTATITATLAPASYANPRQVLTVVSGTSTAKDIALSSSRTWVAQGSTADVPVAARVLSNGSPLSGQTVSFSVVAGSGTVSPASVLTDASGNARTTLHVSGVAGDVQGTACVAPGNNPCQTFYVLSVASSALRLEPVAGRTQVITVGGSFQPLRVRVTDSAIPPNPVLGAPVIFQTMLFRPDQDVVAEPEGDGTTSNHAMNVLYGSSSVTVNTDAYGLAGITPSTGTSNRAVDVDITASTGNAVLQFEMEALWPVTAIPSGSDAGSVSPPSADPTVAPPSQSTASESTASESTPLPDDTPSTPEAASSPSTVRGRRLIGHDPRLRTRMGLGQ